MAVKFEDYYKTLGLARDATAEQIKRAYRKLAQQWHPDRNKDGGAAEKFSKVNEAYEVLKDDEKRKLYDRLGQNWKQGEQFRPPPGYEDLFSGARGSHRGTGPGGMQYEFRSSGGDHSQFFDMFEQLFSGQRDGSFTMDDLLGGRANPNAGYGRGGFSQRAAPSESEHELTISLHEAYHGTTRSLNLQGPGGNKTIDVKVPAGVKAGSKIRLRDQGLLLKVTIAPDPRFAVQGNNLTADVVVSPATAALGGKVQAPTLDGPVTLTIPPGTSSGQKLRLKGKGLGQGSGGGDLFARVMIAVPKTLSDQQKEHYEKLRQLEP